MPVKTEEMPVKTEDLESCVFNEVEFNTLLDGFKFLRASKEYKNCAFTYLNDISGGSGDPVLAEKLLGDYIKSVGSKQTFWHESGRSVSVACVSLGEYVYFTPIEGHIVYRGFIDDVEYTGCGSIVFVKHGSEREQSR